jgi:hypothetical protein
MINVQQITSQLARLPDQALRQYAQMHKNDPYIMALALSESNRRKQMREGAQANVPEQPKVVDQAIQSMAAEMPEDIGIAQLPAGEMEFADGGIVAFDEGGKVERYQSQGLVFNRSLMDMPRFLTDRAKAERDALAEANRRQAMAGFSYEELFGPATPVMVTDPQFRSAGAAAAPARAAAAAAPAAAPGAGGPPQNTAGRRSTGPGVPAAAAGASSGRAETGGLELLGGPGTTAASSGIAGLSSTPSTIKAELAAFMPEGRVADPLATERAELGQALIDAAKEREATRTRQIEEMGLYGVEQEKRLKEREGRVSKQEKELGPMALLQAGLAMMSGTSPYALQNIGIGAQTGLKTYNEGIEKIESAREKLDDAFGRIEMARRSERLLTDKEKAELKADYQKSKIEAKRLAVAGAEQAYGWARQDAGKAFDAYAAEKRLDAEIQSREKMDREKIRAQQAIAAMLPAEMRGAMMLGTGRTDAEKLRSGISALTELKDRMTDTKVAELYAKHVADAKKEVPPATPMTPQEFAQSIRSAVSAFRPTVADVPNTLPRK